jgi:hypothetical protein
MMRHYNTFDSYNDTDNNNNNDNNKLIKKKKKRKYEDCFICFQIINNKKTPFPLKSECYYQKNCTCNGWVHKSCLDYWYEKKPVCPICRNRIYKNSDIMVKIFKTNYKLFVLILFIKNQIIYARNNITKFKYIVYFILSCFFIKYLNTLLIVFYIIPINKEL